MEKINNPSSDFTDNFRAGIKFARYVRYLFICLMMVSFSLGIFFAGTRFNPDWKGIYLVALAVLFSIEAVYSYNRSADQDQEEKILFRISEWVAIAVLVKIVLYLVNGPAQFLSDIPLWIDNFLSSFFTGEYLLALAASMFIWWSSYSYAADFEKLIERENEAEWDELGKVQNALQDIRNRISGRFFFIGAILVVLTVISRLDYTLSIMPPVIARSNNFAPIVNTLGYFLLGIVLVSQTQFTLLRARWISQRSPIAKNLAANWIKYSIYFFLFLAGIVIFLPTNYSLGLFETLGVALQYLGQAVSFLFMLITLPIFLCASLFSLRNQAVSNTPGGAFGVMPEGFNREPVAWFEFIKSLAFWIIFIGVIFFAIRYYILQNAALWKAIQAFPLLHFLSQGWRNLRAWMRKANSGANKIIKAGLRKLRPQKISIPINPLKKYLDLTHLSSREKIKKFYLNMVKSGSDRVIRRETFETPYHYREKLSNEIPDLKQDLEQLTEVFVEAQYSQHTLDEPKAVQAGQSWERIKAAFQNWRRGAG